MMYPRMVVRFWLYSVCLQSSYLMFVSGVCGVFDAGKRECFEINYFDAMHQVEPSVHR
ncbi:hypothetical protein XF_1030 [Xylella fastidiosa 9a5c]|uniref:Uncharacterized protein n=1 Tax=Xylella fastidiosa (strain 9a5c) TaxID=160492 RepID=Q9PEJ8_XYLFA|nr:hypothetical protein XF_1030 [Xylella fastidiosa 9a5c]